MHENVLIYDYTDFRKIFRSCLYLEALNRALPFHRL